MITVSEFKQWLEQFADDTEIDIEGQVYDLPKTVNLEGDYTQSDFMYSPARKEWTYKPTQEAMSRGVSESFHAYRPAEITIGACHC